MNKRFAIIEIGSYNTKTHVYENEKLIYDNNATIKFKSNYNKNNIISKEDIKLLFKEIEKVLKYTSDIHIYGCSIFRSISSEELDDINSLLDKKYKLKIEIVSQEDEAKYTAIGCYSKIKYDGNICIYIGGGGSIELIFVNNKKIINKKFYNFGVVDVTNKFESLKEDIPTCTFDEVYKYVESLINDIYIKADVFILAGGDHLYWYNNAGYKLLENTLYKIENQPSMITKELSDKYDRDTLTTSLDKIRNRSDNPSWFDGARATKVITNLISNKIEAKYIIPTKIAMEDGIKEVLLKK